MITMLTELIDFFVSFVPDILWTILAVGIILKISDIEDAIEAA